MHIFIKNNISARLQQNLGEAYAPFAKFCNIGQLLCANTYLSSKEACTNVDEIAPLVKALQGNFTLKVGTLYSTTPEINKI